MKHDAPHKGLKRRTHTGFPVLLDSRPDGPCQTLPYAVLEMNAPVRFIVLKPPTGRT